jgi:hypothetical protein
MGMTTKLGSAIGILLVVLNASPVMLRAQGAAVQRGAKPAATKLVRPEGVPSAALRYTFGKIELPTGVSPSAVVLGASRPVAL